MRAATIALGLLTLGAAAVAQTPGPLAADQTGATAAGTTFTAPAAWSVLPMASVVQIIAPDDSLRVAIVDVGPANDAPAAIDVALACYGPRWSPALRAIGPASARNGWDERQTAIYQPSPDAKLAAQAIALRKSTAWTVVLIERATAAAGNRLSAADRIARSLHPPRAVAPTPGGCTTNR
ncbi:MAG: hypothetical protein RQ833_08145 [Sphingomonadaceae bacterium]|nr:hypothetical protein [Sphingomonadaceae bacterium]